MNNCPENGACAEAQPANQNQCAPAEPVYLNEINHQFSNFVNATHDQVLLDLLKAEGVDLKPEDVNPDKLRKLGYEYSRTNFPDGSYEATLYKTVQSKKYRVSISLETKEVSEEK